MEKQPIDNHERRSLAMMKRDVYAALASVTLSLLGAATVKAEDVGCCRVECRGPNTVRVTLNDSMASECQPSSQECSATWSAESCPKGEGPGVPGVGGFVIQREDVPAAQR